MYTINNLNKKYKYIELSSEIKNDFIGSILLGVDNKNFKRNINDFKDVIVHYKTKLNSIINKKYKKNFSKNSKDHLNILEKIIKYNIIIYNFNKNNISYKNNIKNFDKYIVLLNKNKKIHLIFKYNNEKKITKLSKCEILNTNNMIGGGLIVSKNKRRRTGNPVNRDNQVQVNNNLNYQYPLNNRQENEDLKDSINKNLENIKKLINNDKINTILQKLSGIIKIKINRNEIVFNPMKNYNNNNNNNTNIIDYKDIIELYLLNGQDAKKDFENVPNVFTKKCGEKQYDYFKNYKIFEYYIIFYNLMKDDSDEFKLNIVTRKLAEYMSDDNYNGRIKTFFQNYINISTGINQDLFQYISIYNYSFNNFNNIFEQLVSDVEFFVSIALDDFRFNQEYTSFNVLNHLYSNLKNDKLSNIINKNSNQYTIFKLYDAQNNAKTQSSNLEINSIGDDDYIKQVVLLSNFIDAGNISSDALNRLQDYKKYIHRNNIDKYKEEVHNNFIKLCKIFTLKKDANIEIFEFYNNTNNNNTNDYKIIRLNNIIANDSNNILDILDPLTILKNHLDKTIDINKQYNILLKIGDFKIFNIIIKYKKLQNYIDDKSQYLEYKIENYNNINTIAFQIKNIKGNKGNYKQKKILKLLNLKALGDFSHCIFLKIFKTYFNKPSQIGAGDVQDEQEIIDVKAIKNINDDNLNKLSKLFYFNENKVCYLFRYNSRKIDIDYYEKLEQNDKNILPVKYLTINNTEFLDIEKKYLYFDDNLYIILNNKINNNKLNTINLNNLKNIDVDIVNLLYNFFYILCDNLENPKNPINKKGDLIIKIDNYKNNIRQINISNINIQEYNYYINSILESNNYINNNIQKDIGNLHQNKFYIIGILNILMKVYLYDELLFIIMARKFYSTFIKENTNSEDELIKSLIKLYEEINEKNNMNTTSNNSNIEKKNYIYKVNKYFSISQKIVDKLNNNGNTNFNLIGNGNSLNEKINKLISEYNTNSILPNNTRKMFMISTVDNLLKTYCLANDLSFSVDGVTIIYK